MKIMCILTSLALLVCSTIVLKVLWLIRIGTLAHWSYVIGSAVYPQDIKESIIFSVGVFGFIVIGTFVPAFLFPRIKFVATALSIPPQIHMLMILHRNIASRIENRTLGKTIQAYAAMSLLSMVWTIVSLIRN